MYFVLGDNERISNGVEKLSIASLLTSKINSKSLSTSSTSQLILAELTLTLSKVSAFQNHGGSISSLGSVVTVKVFVTKYSRRFANYVASEYTRSIIFSFKSDQHDIFSTIQAATPAGLSIIP